jgi:hypothetical protein
VGWRVIWPARRAWDQIARHQAASQIDAGLPGAESAQEGYERALAELGLQFCVPALVLRLHFAPRLSSRGARRADAAPVLAALGPGPSVQVELYATHRLALRWEDVNLDHATLHETEQAQQPRGQ